MISQAILIDVKDTDRSTLLSMSTSTTTLPIYLNIWASIALLCNDARIASGNYERNAAKSSKYINYRLQLPSFPFSSQQLPNAATEASTFHSDTQLNSFHQTERWKYCIEHVLRWYLRYFFLLLATCKVINRSKSLFRLHWIMWLKLFSLLVKTTFRLWIIYCINANWDANSGP